MLTRFSKYDFWIPGQILDFKYFFEKNIIFFEIEKNIEKVRNLEKVGNFRNFKDFQWVSLVHYYGNPLKILKISKISHFFKILIFFQDFFDFKKKRKKRNKILKSKICSGIQKSHLENCTSI